MWMQLHGLRGRENNLNITVPAVYSTDNCLRENRKTWEGYTVCDLTWVSVSVCLSSCKQQASNVTLSLEVSPLLLVSTVHAKARVVIKLKRIPVVLRGYTHAHAHTHECTHTTYLHTHAHMHMHAHTQSANIIIPRLLPYVWLSPPIPTLESGHLYGNSCVLCAPFEDMLVNSTVSVLRSY